MDTNIISQPGQQLTRPLDYTTQQIIKEALGSLQAFPVNAIYINVSGTNAGTELGYGTWIAFGAGKVLVGFNSGDPDFGTALQTGGEKTHTLSTSEMPSHSHNLFVGQTGSGSPSVSALGLTTGAGSSGYITSTGSGSAHNNIQPYIVAYFWKRTA